MRLGVGCRDERTNGVLITIFWTGQTYAAVPLRGRGRGGVCIHSLGFIGCLRSDDCSANPFHCRPSERDIRLRLDGVVDYGLLWWMINRGSLGERGVESSARICEPVDDLLACDVEGGLTLYKDRCSKHREWECECDDG